MEGSGDERPVYGGDGVGLIIGLCEKMRFKQQNEEHGRTLTCAGRERLPEQVRRSLVKKRIMKLLEALLIAAFWIMLHENTYQLVQLCVRWKNLQKTDALLWTVI